VTANQFRTALDRLGLSQLGAARLFNANDRTVRRWAIGERGVPPTVAILLKLMIAGKVTAEDIEATRGRPSR
jgi:transcriptional regulator with XRE-family HTH domain